MIKNIVFDMGNVLLRFEPETFVERLGLGTEESNTLLEIVYDAPEWYKQDSGELTEEAFLKLVEGRLPEELRQYAYPLVKEWDQPLILVEGMEELISGLKEKGYGIYLLSNASTRQPEYWARVPASKYFDGALISAEVKMLKPEARIYQCLFETFSLKPEECVFIDDLEVNIKGAEEQGMQGYVFDGDVTALRKYLSSVLSDFS